MKKVLLAVAVIAALGLVSCKDDDKKTSCICVESGWSNGESVMKDYTKEADNCSDLNKEIGSEEDMGENYIIISCISEEDLKKELEKL